MHSRFEFASTIRFKYFIIESIFPSVVLILEEKKNKKNKKVAYIVQSKILLFWNITDKNWQSLEEKKTFSEKVHSSFTSDAIESNEFPLTQLRPWKRRQDFRGTTTLEHRRLISNRLIFVSRPCSPRFCRSRWAWVAR